MQIDNYAYELSVDDLVPPIGDYRYVAKIDFFGVREGDKFKKYNLGIAETWGRTRGEAQEKLKKLINEWITKQNSSKNQSSSK